MTEQSNNNPKSTGNMKRGWEYKKLGEVCDIYGRIGFRGYTRADYVNTIEEGAISISPSNIVNSQLDFSKCTFITWDKYNQSPEIKIYEGDVIFVKTASVGKCAFVSRLPHESTINPQFVVFKNIIINNRFLFYELLSYNFQDKVKRITTGTSVPTITQKGLSGLEIACPNNKEQQRIVEELDLLSSIIEKKKAQLKELDSLAQSIFYDMFGDPVTNEKGWEVKKLGEVCNEIGDGLHGTPQYDPNGDIAFINGNNLIEGKIVITEKTQFVNRTEALKIYIELDSSTILLSINGTLGKIALYNNEIIVLGKSACYIKLSDALNRRFVMALMSTHTFKAFLENNSSKSTIKNVGLKAIRNYKIILPPLSLQQQFAEKVEAIEHQKELIKQSIKEVETLFNSRMDYYFDG